LLDELSGLLQVRSVLRDLIQSQQRDFDLFMTGRMLCAFAAKIGDDAIGGAVGDIQ
jgi:hypothetical protein